MAQTGSAQREPSMEEILASIRRIIEDSDSARQPLDEVGPSQPLSCSPADADSHLRQDDGEHAQGRREEGRHEVEAFQAELHEAAVVRMPAATWHEEPVHEETETATGVTQSRDEPRAEPELHKGAEAAGVVQFGPAFVLPQGPSRPAFPVENAEARQAFDAPEVDEGRVDAARDAQPSEGRQTLMSDHAGRQVAAAFGELSEAFAANRRRSFDEMAEEMLRPMLQDWLDNNLPTLVEKLVREEIERVARGS